MPTQRKPTPRKAAFKATELPSARVETDRRIPLIILAVIAAIMALVLIFTQCSGPSNKDMPAPGEEAIVEGEEVEEAIDEDIEPPSNPDAKESLADYTWEELSEISNKIASTSTEDDALYVAKQYHLVGSNGKLDGSATKSVSLGDGTTAQVRLIGFNQDDISDGSGRAGLTFMFADGVSSMAFNEDGSNYGGWPSSSISYYLGVEFWSLLPEDLTEQIVEVSKLSNTGGEDSTVETGDIMWLPSYIELTGQVDLEFQDSAAILQQEGSQYKLFADSGVSSSENNSLLVMHDSGQASAWWLRSVDSANDNTWYYVNAAGHPTNNGTAEQEYLVVPCFCI